MRNFLPLLAFPFLFLTACGGGSSDSSSDSVVETTESAVQISSRSWGNSDLAYRTEKSFETAFSQSTLEWKILISDETITQKSHIQVYLDVDNDSSTGFQFDNEAWASKSGADYLIQDSTLFKSTSNSSNWDWESISQVERTFNNSNTINISIPIEQLSGLCNNYAIGVIGMNKDWQIEIFNPQSNSLIDQSIAYCENIAINQRPVITLLDTTPLILDLGSEFIAPTVSALDHEDGDLSNSVESINNVDTSKVGTYAVVYSVSDSAGLSSASVERIVVVRTFEQDEIVIDGNSDDWNSIEQINTGNNNSTTIKITDTETHLYVLIESQDLDENTQIFVDSFLRNHPDPSYDLSTFGGFRFGKFRYLIENQDFGQYLGEEGANQWTWNFQSSDISIVRNSNILEMSIPISLFNGIDGANSIWLSFFNLNSNWEIVSEISAFSFVGPYRLLFPRAPKANRDNDVVVFSTQSVVIDPLNNDTDPNGDVISIIKVDTFNKGTAVISGSKIVFTPFDNVSGIINIGYTISDPDGNTDDGSIGIEVFDN